MRKTLIAVIVAVLGAGASTAFAQPTLDFSSNRVWRNAPESTAAEALPDATAEKQPEAAPKRRKLTPAYEQKQPFVFNP
jgi:hypothetical protein